MERSGLLEILVRFASEYQASVRFARAIPLVMDDPCKHEKLNGNILVVRPPTANGKYNTTRQARQ